MRKGLFFPGIVVLMALGLYADETFLTSDPPTQQTRCNGEPVVRFGKTWIYGQAPDLLEIRTLQQGNTNRLEKVRPKKSSEITWNGIGINTSGMPRSRTNDYQPCEPIHLIDGDVETCWMSRGKRLPDAEPAWVRLDFPREKTIHKVVLKERPKGYVRPAWTKIPQAGCVEVGQGMPPRVKIEASRDNVTWQTLYEGETDGTPEWVASFAPVAAKSVRVTALSTEYVEQFGYAFSIGELEIYDTENVNTALVSSGTGILASSTEQGRNEIDLLRTLWPAHGDAGFKWVRIGYHDDPINWHEVEKVKGTLEVDPMTDAAITELANMGLNIVMCLNFGNRLYAPDAKSPRPFPQLWEWYYDSPPPPVTPEALAAWDRYVAFIVTKYRDRVKYFEVWNEWNIPLYWGGPVDEEHYVTLAKRTIPIIRRLAPDAKILVGSTSGFPTGCRNWQGDAWKNDPRTRVFAALIPLVDVLSWHPHYQPDPESESFLHYAEDVRALKKWAQNLGFRGDFMATEWNMSYNYPDFLEIDQKRLWRGKVRATEMEKAKYTAQMYVQDTGLGMPSFFCEMNNPFYGALDLSLFRRTVDTDPLTTLQPEAAYYVVRNLATQMENFQPAAWVAEVPALEKLRTFAFDLPDGHALALWFAGKASDTTPGVPVDITLPFEVREVVAMEPANGTRQTLKYKVENGKTTLKAVLVSDMPLLLRTR
ncbi:MAG: discoidin domain-containing protein [Planctomycetia bacterium]|nr:discoidin domain-containing protein [Planctomycetia bacterium]